MSIKPRMRPGVPQCGQASSVACVGAVDNYTEGLTTQQIPHWCYVALHLGAVGDLLVSMATAPKL